MSKYNHAARILRLGHHPWLCASAGDSSAASCVSVLTDGCNTLPPQRRPHHPIPAVIHTPSSVFIPSALFLPPLSSATPPHPTYVRRAPPEGEHEDDHGPPPLRRRVRQRRGGRGQLGGRGGCVCRAPLAAARVDAVAGGGQTDPVRCGTASGFFVVVPPGPPRVRSCVRACVRICVCLYVCT